MPWLRAGAAAAGGGALLLALTASPFLLADLGWDWRWTAPVGFQTLWCLVEGWNTARHRPGTVPMDSRKTILPAATGLMAMAVAALALADRFFQFRAIDAAGWALPPLAAFAIGAVGVGIRQVAILTLGERFRDEVALGEEHVIETGGIYRLLRHPGETGFALGMAGLVALCESLPALGLYALGLLPLMALRIGQENRMLREAR